MQALASCILTFCFICLFLLFGRFCLGRASYSPCFSFIAYGYAIFTFQRGTIELAGYQRDSSAYESTGFIAGSAVMSSKI